MPPERGEFLKAHVPSDGVVFGHNDMPTPCIRLDARSHELNLTVIPRSTRRGTVPDGNPWPGSVLSAPVVGTSIDKWAELLCWTPRSTAPNLAVPYGTACPELAKVAAAVREYTVPQAGSGSGSPAPLTRQGHVLVQNKTRYFLVVSNNAAAAWRLRNAMQVASVVEIELDNFKLDQDETPLVCAESTHPAEAQYVSRSGLPVARAYLDTFSTLDLGRNGPWSLHRGHFVLPRFGALAASLTKLLLADLHSYLGLNGE